MKQIKRKILKCMVTVIMLFCLGIPVQAAMVNQKLPSKQTVTLYNAKDMDALGKKENVHLLGYVEGKKVTNVKSSKPSVMTVKASGTKMANGKIWTNFNGTAKKAGMTTISYKMGGKTYKVKVTVKKYVNPISSIKVGNTTVSKSKFRKSANYKLAYAKFAQKKCKFVIKLASGWDFADKASGSNGSIWYGKGYDLRLTELPANGKKITVKGGKGFTVCFTAVKKSTGQTEDIYIFFK